MTGEISLCWDNNQYCDEYLQCHSPRQVELRAGWTGAGKALSGRSDMISFSVLEFLRLGLISVISDICTLRQCCYRNKNRNLFDIHSGEDGPAGWVERLAQNPSRENGTIDK